MASSSFTHPSEPQVDPLTGPYSGNFNDVDKLRVRGEAKGDPRDSFAPNLSWNSQEVSRRLADQRDTIRKERELAYNPLMDNLMATAPKELQSVLKAAKKSGLFTEAGKQAWADPVLQAKYGNVPEAFERMQSTGIAFTSTVGGQNGMARGRGVMGDMQSVVQSHAEGLTHANALTSKMTENWTKQGSAYAGGMNLEQSLNVAGYMARQGGQGFMGRADVSAEEKAEKVRPHLQSVGRAMQVFETKDAGEAIKHIKELTGRDISQFSEGDAKQLTAKLKKIDEMALATGRSAKEIGETMGNIRQAMNIAGPGNVRGYTGSKGSSVFAKEEAQQAEKMTYQINKTANDLGYSQEEREDLTKVVTSEAMRVKNTTGGRAMDVLSKLAATGVISQDQLAEERKNIKAGKNVGDIITRIGVQTNQDLHGVIRNDEAFAQFSAQKIEEMNKIDPTGELATNAKAQAMTMTAEKLAVDKKTWDIRGEKTGAQKALANTRRYGDVTKEQSAEAMSKAKASAMNFLEDEAKRTGMSDVKLKGMREMISKGEWGELKESDLGQQITASYERDFATNRATAIAGSARGKAGVTNKRYDKMIALTKLSGKDFGGKVGDEKFAMVLERTREMAAGGDAKAAMYLEEMAEETKKIAENKRHEGAIADEATVSAAHGQTAAERRKIKDYQGSAINPDKKPGAVVAPEKGKTITSTLIDETKKAITGSAAASAGVKAGQSAGAESAASAGVKAGQSAGAESQAKQEATNRAANSEEKTKTDVAKAESKKSADNKQASVKITGTVKVDLQKNEMSFGDAEMIIVEGTV